MLSEREPEADPAVPHQWSVCTQSQSSSLYGDQGILWQLPGLVSGGAETMGCALGAGLCPEQPLVLTHPLVGAHLLSWPHINEDCFL